MRVRFAAMVVCRQKYEASLPVIGRAFARHHVTILSGLREAELLMKHSPAFIAMVERIRTLDASRTRLCPACNGSGLEADEVEAPKPAKRRRPVEKARAPFAKKPEGQSRVWRVVPVANATEPTWTCSFNGATEWTGKLPACSRWHRDERVAADHAMNLNRKGRLGRMAS